MLSLSREPRSWVDLGVLPRVFLCFVWLRLIFPRLRCFSDVCSFAARTSVYGVLRCAPAYGVLRRATLSRHPQRPFGPNNELPPSSCRAPTTTLFSLLQFQRSFTYAILIFCIKFYLSLITCFAQTKTQKHFPFNNPFSCILEHFPSTSLNFSLKYFSL